MFKSTWINRLAIVLVAFGSLGANADTPAADTASYIVQVRDGRSAAELIESAGGTVEHELPIIDGASARLTAEQAAILDAEPGVEVMQDLAVKAMGGPMLDTSQRVLIGADKLWAQGFDGAGVTVAFIDTGVWYSWGPIKNNTSGNNRILRMYNAITNKEQNTPDKSGHGTHVWSIIASSNISDTGQPQGIAPNVNMVAVDAFDDDGGSSYSTVIKGLDWVLANRTSTTSGCSTCRSAPPRSRSTGTTRWPAP